MAKDALRFLDTDGIQPPFPLSIGCVLNKEASLKQYVNYMLDRTNAMFEYDGLPDTIPAYMLELYLQIFGYAAFVEVDETNPITYPSALVTKPGLYIFYGGIGGERDIYYRPRMFTVANPRIKNSIQATILYDDDDFEVSKPCVIMRNDRNYCGLLPLFNRYASQLVENDISIRSAQINARAQVAIQASSDRDKETARKYLDDLEAGKTGVIGETAFLEGIQVANVGTQSANVVIQLIELQQYLKASWYNELGLNVNFNMKREYMSEEEIAVNTDILLPLVDDMLACREEACELINKTFGTSISVRKSSAWANKEQEDLAALAEASASGGIGLKDTIEDKIEGDFSPTKGGDNNAENVQREVSQTVSDSESEGENQKPAGAVDGSASVTEPDSTPEESVDEGTGDVCPEQERVIVNVVINNGDGTISNDIQGEESESSDESDNSKPETQEKPEEPDAE